MNFATLKGLTIPEGNVTQITDESGNVIWSAVKKAIVTISGSGGERANVTIDGVTYNTATTIEVPIGTIINCVATTQYASSTIFCNLETIASGTNAQYEYTVVSDVTITLSSYTPMGQPSGYTYGEIVIMDVTAPPFAIIDITTSGYIYSYGSVTVNGNSYGVTKKVFAPIGSAVKCSATWQKHWMSDSYVGGEISVNGNVVAPIDTSVNPTIYEFTLLRDIKVAIFTNSISTGNYGSIGFGSTISITEL